MSYLNFTLPIDRNGRQVYSALAQYEIVREPSLAEAANDPAYYGGLDPNGQWYIRKRQVSTGVHQYVRGSAGFAAAWADKVSQAYDEYDEIF